MEIVDPMKMIETMVPPLAAHHWFSEGSKSLSQQTSQCVQVMFKANNDFYKKDGFSTCDHTWVRKKTHENKLDGLKHVG